MQEEEKKNLKLEEHLILYIDILGYQQQIDTHGEEKFLNIIEECFQRCKDTIKIFGTMRNIIFKHKFFSDNIIICLQVTNFKGCYRFFFDMASVMQYGLTTRKISIRGAITMGSLYLGDNYVYGKGLIRAYELENSFALFPRIIIDPKTYKFFDISQEVCVQEDNDGYRFINYLRNNNEFLVTHCDFITKKLKEYKENHYILHKYLWCKNYHNRVCEENGLREHLISYDPYALEGVPI